MSEIVLVIVCIYIKHIQIYIYIYIYKYYQIQSSGSNDFGQHGATALGSALRENRHLQVLDVRMNHIGDPGAAWRGGKSRAPAERNLDGLQLGHTWSTYIYLYNLIYSEFTERVHDFLWDVRQYQWFCWSAVLTCGHVVFEIIQIPTSQSSLDGKIWQEAVV